MLPGRIGTLSRVLLLSLLGVVCAEGPAAAKNCYEDIGCPHKRKIGKAELMSHGCEGLRHFRNSIFQGNGYCFQTAVARKQYGNAGCRFRKQGDVPLNSFERANIATIRSVERAKGC